MMLNVKSNRVGINCGECPSGLSNTFGFYGCKRCSNYWLFLLIVFMLAGILLVVSLFALNLTIVDGKIYGFIVYANLVAGLEIALMYSHLRTTYSLYFYHCLTWI